MRLDFKSLAFGYKLVDGVSTPAWETSLGQGAGYKINNTSSINELVKGMIYKMVAPKTISFKKGRGGTVVKGDAENASLVSAAVFDKVFINENQILNGKFILLIVKDDSESHKGRLKLKYGLDNSYEYSDGTIIKNRDFQSIAAAQLGLAENACWFVYDISVKGQDALHLSAIIVNKDGEETYANSAALHKAWDALIEADSSVKGLEFDEQNQGVEVVSDIIPDNLSVEDLGHILADMYNMGKNKVAGIHMFGVKYGSIIAKCGYSANSIVAASGISASYDTEVSKGLRLHEALLSNEYGVRFGDEECEYPQLSSETYVELSAAEIFSGFEPWLTSPSNPDYTGKQKYNGYARALVKLVDFMYDNNLIEDSDLNDKNIDKYISWIGIYKDSAEAKDFDVKKNSNMAGSAALNKYVKYIKYLITPHVVDFDYSITKNTAVNKIFYGVPGCGKSYHIDYKILGKNKATKEYKGEYEKDNIIRTTFYQDYSNTDFVGQILPKVVKGDEGEKDTVEYIFNPGPFTLALIQAISNPTKKVALVIEEINRGNAPAIFGDIFQLLDRDEHSISEYGIVNVGMIDYLNSYEFVVNGEKKRYNFNEIKIPGNMDIFATMNTSDQNVYTLDTAFTRRWSKEHIPNAFNGHKIEKMYVPGMSSCAWGTFVDTINNQIRDNLESLQVNEDKQVGCFFVKETDLLEKPEDSTEQNAKMFAYKVLEYLWSDVSKLDHQVIFNPKYTTFEGIVKDFAKGVAVFNDKLGFKPIATPATDTE